MEVARVISLNYSAKETNYFVRQALFSEVKGRVCCCDCYFVDSFPSWAWFKFPPGYLSPRLKFVVVSFSPFWHHCNINLPSTHAALYYSCGLICNTFWVVILVDGFFFYYKMLSQQRRLWRQMTLHSLTVKDLGVSSFFGSSKVLNAGTEENKEISWSLSRTECFVFPSWLYWVLILNWAFCILI